MTPEAFEALLDKAAAQLGDEVRASVKYHPALAFQGRVLDVLRAIGKSEGVEVNPTFNPHAFPDIRVNGWECEIAEGTERVIHLLKAAG